MRAAAVSALVLAACANLPDVPRDECGNGVLEGTEECDGVEGCGAAESANACFHVCEAGAACPDGWGCGADLRCRRPTEAFVASPVTSMSTAGVSVRDMDGDGAADLLGYDSRGLVTRYGDWDGAMSAQTRVPMPYSETGSITPDVDGAQGLDLAVPIGDAGWALFMNDGARGLVPAAQSAISLNFPGDCSEVTTAAAVGGPSGAAELILSFGGLFIAFIDNDECGNSPDCVLSVEGGPLVDKAIRTAALGYGPTDGVWDGEQFTAAVVGEQTVSVWGHDLTASRPKRLGTWILPEPLAENAHIAFLELDGSCPSLVVDTGTSLAVVWGTCSGLANQLGLAISYPRPRGAVIGHGNLTGRDALLLAQSLVIGIPEDGAPDGALVSAYGWNTSTDAWESQPLLATDNDPHAAAVLDYNRDGLPDVALALDGTSTVDFYLHHGGTGFAVFPADVGGTPRIPVVGDFDADLFPDVVVAVADPTNPQGRDHLYIIWGDPSGHPPPAQFLGDFVAEARPAVVNGMSQSLSESLLVTSNKLAPDPDDCDRRLAILIGDTSRQLISPYVVLHNTGTDLEALAPQGMLDISSPGVPEVLAFGTYPDDTTGDLHLVATVLGFDGTSYTTTGVSVDVPDSTLPYWYASGAQWRSGDVNGDDVTDAAAFAFDKLVVVTRDGDSLDADVQDLPAEMQFPPWFELVDMDADGDLDLAGAGTAGSGPANRLWVMWNEGGAFDVAGATTVDLDGEYYCFDADVIRSNDSGAPQLLASCYRVTDESFDRVLMLSTFGDDPDTRFLPLDGEPQSIEVGDFTADGLDDIAVLGSASLTLYRQCRDDEAMLGAGCVRFAAP